MFLKPITLTAREISLFDALGEAVIIVDREYNVIHTNAGFRQTFTQGIKGNKCYNRIGREAPCQICTCSQSSRIHSVQKKDEKLNDIHYRVSSQAVSHGRLKTFYIEKYEDITYSKTLEESLTAKNTLLKSNLDIAKHVQQSLLPAPFSDSAISFSYKYIPSEALGGDFFGIYKLDDKRYGFFIADVSGHGISAAMLTMFLNSSYDKGLSSPAAILMDIFSAFNGSSFQKDQYIALFYAIFDPLSGEITYCNAGLNSFPVIYNQKTGSAKLLESYGFPVSNWTDAPNYTDSKLIVDRNEKLLFYTDGVTEAKNKSGIAFGAERLIRALLEGNPSEKLTLERIICYIEDFTNEGIEKTRDDVSLIILDFTSDLT